MKKIISLVVLFTMVCTHIIYANETKNTSYYRLAQVISKITGQNAKVVKIENTGYHNDSGWKMANEDVIVTIESPVWWAKGKYLCTPCKEKPKKPDGIKTWFWFGDYAEYNPKYLLGYMLAVKID